MTDGNKTPGWISQNFEEIAAFAPAVREARECFVAACRRDVWLSGLCRPHHRLARKKFDPASRGVEAPRGRPAFTTWLREQAGRNDGVGALARDLAEGARLGRNGRRYATPDTFARMLREHHRPSPRYTAALTRAAQEWEAGQ